MTLEDTLARARKAFLRESWAEAYDLLDSAARRTSLEPEDLEQLAKAAYLVGRDSECADIWARAHREYLGRENTPRAIYCAFWLGMILFDQGETAQGSGWMARARGLSDDYPGECAEQGLLLVPEALQCMRQGKPGKAHDLFSRAVEIGRRFSDPNLTTLGRLGRGQALVLQGELSDGTTLLDEAMVAAMSDGVSPLVVGLVYCAVVQTCQDIYDLRRAREWTTALARWCDAHPELIPYRGQCLVRRAEVMQLHGEWQHAIVQAARAVEMLSESRRRSLAGQAFYRQGELYRLQGKFSEAMEMYAQASQRGLNPQPGLALLRLAQGKVDVARAAIRQAEREQRDAISRSRILPAYAEIMIEANDAQAAQAAADELSEIAAAFRADYLQAVSGHAQGSILLSRGEPHAALEHLRSAWTRLSAIGAEYEAARTRVLIGAARRELGDDDTAALELEAAREVFRHLGAAPDRKRVDAVLRTASSGATHGLTRREQEVLRHLATGETNKEIAADLFISERTVDRHVSNIFRKLDVGSRAAATAYAFEHEIVSS